MLPSPSHERGGQFRTSRDLVSDPRLPVERQCLEPREEPVRRGGAWSGSCLERRRPRWGPVRPCLGHERGGTTPIRRILPFRLVAVVTREWIIVGVVVPSIFGDLRRVLRSLAAIERLDKRKRHIGTRGYA